MSPRQKGSSRKRVPPYDRCRCGSMAEQLICNQQVNGSSPLIGSIFQVLCTFSILDGFPSGQRGQTVNLLQIASMVRIHHHPFNAGWSSLEARRAHNPKVTGSNPVPATLLEVCQAQAHPSLASGLQTLRVSKFCFAEPLPSGASMYATAGCTFARKDEQTIFKNQKVLRAQALTSFSILKMAC